MTEILRTTEEEEIRQTFIQDLSKYPAVIGGFLTVILNQMRLTERHCRSTVDIGFHLLSCDDPLK
jgi:hypothetical protein